MFQQKQMLENQETTHQQQLRQINILFDEKAQEYEIIDFAGLYNLLEQVKTERERERERESQPAEVKPIFSKQRKKSKK